MSKTRVCAALVALLIALPFANVQIGHAQETETITEEVQYFPTTDKVVAGKLLDYWREHGSLAQQGYPISDEFIETSDTDGKTYTTQYFERAVLESHPDNPAPYDVEGALLGSQAYAETYPNGAPGQQASTANPATIPETGKTVGGEFRTYWENHGGVMALGYPISDEFQETSDLDGKTRTVQYFERAELESHPDEAAPHNVQVAQLGTQEYQSKYSSTSPPQAVTVPKPPRAGCKSNLTPGLWKGPALWNGVARSTGLGGTASFSATMGINVACDGSFTGTANADKFTAEAKAGPLRLASCKATTLPILEFNGKVVPRADGLHLAVTKATWKQGKLTCEGAAISPTTKDLTGKTLTPYDIPIEFISESGDRIGGSTKFLDKPLEDAINEQLQTIRPGTKISLTSTGVWEMALQK